MTPFEIDSTPDAVCLRLKHEVTIEHARLLHQALLATLVPGRTLLLDLGAVTRIDAAVLQILFAAAQVAPGASLTSVSPVWTAALQRHGLTDPFLQP